MKAKKLVALILATVTVLSLTACGGGNSSQGPNEKNYIAIYDAESGTDVLNTLPAYQFLPADVRQGLAGEMRLELTFLIEYGTDYTLVAHYFNPNQTDTAAADYFNFNWGIVGTSEYENGTYTLKAAEMGDASYTAGSKYSSDAAYNCFSFNGDGTNGSWYSDDTNAILDMAPAGTTVTVNGNAITGWTVPEA